MNTRTILMLLLVAGCDRGRGVPGSGQSKMESRDVGSFEEIEFDSLGRVEVDIGKQTPLSLTGDDNILPLVTTQLAGKRLVIRNAQQIKPKLNLVFKVGVPNVSTVEANGAGSITISGVKNEHLAVTLRGMGSVTATGRTEHLVVTVAGAGQVDARRLESTQAKATLTGMGSADLNVKDSLDATVTGIGSITYSGDPKVTKKVSGIGTVRKK